MAVGAIVGVVEEEPAEVGGVHVGRREDHAVDHCRAIAAAWKELGPEVVLVNEQRSSIFHGSEDRRALRDFPGEMHRVRFVECCVHDHGCLFELVCWLL